MTIKCDHFKNIPIEGYYYISGIPSLGAYQKISKQKIKSLKSGVEEREMAKMQLCIWSTDREEIEQTLAEELR